MPNRSFLPSFFGGVSLATLENVSAAPLPLEVLEITFLHFHSAMELGVCVSGRGTCLVEDVEYPFEAGDVQIIFPFQRHLSRSEGSEHSQWYWLNLDPVGLLGGLADLPRLEKLLYTQMGLCGIIDRRRYPLAAELIARVVLPGPKALRCACLHALIEELAAQSATLSHLQLRPGHAFIRLEPALTLVQQALENGTAAEVAALSDACGMSPAAFRRSFHQAMGQSPQQYVQICQMRKAQQLLLLTDLPVTDVALAVGYQDVSGFNRRFLKTFGMPPRRYRQSGGLQQDGQIEKE